MGLYYKLRTWLGRSFLDAMRFLAGEPSAEASSLSDSCAMREQRAGPGSVTMSVSSSKSSTAQGIGTQSH